MKPIPGIHREALGAIALVAVLALAAACAGRSQPEGQIRGQSSSPGSPSSGTTLQSSAGVAPSDAAASAGSNGASKSAPAAGAPAGGSGGAALALPSTLDRKMIMTATLDVTAADVSRAFEDAGNIAAAAGGFIASSTFGHNGDRETASLTIRVPADRYQDALNGVRRLGEVKGEQSGSNDVTEQYTDLQSRLRNLQATEQQYLQFLGRANDISEVLQVQDRLNGTRADIEQVQGRINLLDHQTDLATITVHLEPPVAGAEEPKPSGGSGPLHEARRSFQASLDVLAGAATVALAVLAFSWWIAPLAAAGLYFGMRQRRAAGARPAPPPAPAP